MSSLKRLAWEMRSSLRHALFANNQPLSVNLRYARYHRRSRASWRPIEKPAEEDRALAISFRDTGYAVLPPPPRFSQPDLATLKARVDALFACAEASVSVGTGLLRLIDGAEQLPQLVDFIDPHLERVLEAYFESHFKIYGIYVYHTTPNPSRPESSFLWHTDNCPSQEIKLMVYLDDVAVDTGAIRLKSRSISDGLRARGFTDRRRYNRFAEELDNPKTTCAVEGPIGTRILFQNGSTIHKAVAPARSHRDVATFVIIPSTVHWRPHLARTRHLLSTNSGICLDPFVDRPQSVGYLD